MATAFNAHIRELASFCRKNKLALNDPKSLSLFFTSVKGSIDESLNSPILKYGKHVETMFEAMVVGFGKYRLLKIEDCGRVHPKDAFKIPDFRIILNDGSQWLIEVKNLYQKKPFEQHFQIREQDIFKMNRYAEEMRCELKIAIFWSRWGVWTLVAPSELTHVGNKFQVEFGRAVQINEMTTLGDVSIGTTPEFRREVQSPASLKGLDIPSRRAVFVPWKPSRRRGFGMGNPTFCWLVAISSG